jgi:hypothetical protein
VVLGDNVLVEVFLYFSGAWQFFEAAAGFTGLFAVLQDDVVAQVDAVGADIDLVWAFDEGVLLCARPAAEAAYGPCSLVIGLFGHWLFQVKIQVSVLL